MLKLFKKNIEYIFRENQVFEFLEIQNYSILGKSENLKDFNLSELANVFLRMCQTSGVFEIEYYNILKLNIITFPQSLKREGIINGKLGKFLGIFVSSSNNFQRF